MISFCGFDFSACEVSKQFSGFVSQCVRSLSSLNVFVPGCNVSELFGGLYARM